VNKREVDDWIELILPQCQLMLQLLVFDAELSVVRELDQED
jgi:hypothetical protein